MIIRQNSSGGSKAEFDYPKFLDQIRSPEAKDILRYLENFVRELDRKTYTFKQLTKNIHEFMDFILVKMVNNQIWFELVKKGEELEEESMFNNREELIEYLQEGIEQYLMNRLHIHCFCPIGSEDNERDHILEQRYKFFKWIKESHLDIIVTDHNQYYLLFASQELQKVNKFKTPRHKMICLLNCCKYLFALLKKMEKEDKGSSGGADSFLPLLILTILKAAPKQLFSNLQYIQRFRHPSKLLSEPGYYLTQFYSACSFIENIEPTSLSITKEEFDKNLEDTLKELDMDTTTSLPITPLSQDHPISPTPILSNHTTIKEQNNNNNSSGRESPLTQRIRRPLDLMNKFINDVTNPIINTGSDNEDLLNNNNNNNTINKKDLKKKKSFLLQLFGSSSEEDSNEEENNIYNNNNNNNNNNQPMIPISSPLPLPFDTGIAMLIEMFPTYEPQVLNAVLEAKDGDLTTCIETILQMDMSPPPLPQRELSRENSEENIGKSRNEENDTENLIDL
ncbi:hypothetical protein K502DRAFT_292627 [Neoconidiobolus thromboides FSU 785]|nr:hypothetical protein K502DRAFT_292627 [Neoconidiobolus thromboides FSU 785]